MRVADVVAAVTAVTDWPSAGNQRTLATLLDDRGTSADAARLRADILQDLVDNCREREPKSTRSCSSPTWPCGPTP